jgi:uncharacterized protein (UPF0548 family)
MFLLAAPSADKLESIRRQQEGADLTYSEVGASLGRLPGGYRHLQRSAAFDAADFDTVRSRLRGWEMHRAAGIRLTPPSPPIEEGTTIAQAIRVWPLTAVACCRIVRVVDEDDRFGFAYGTLPAHPERGEEAFVVLRDEEGATATVTAFSQPQHPLSRVGGPLTHFMQSRVSDRYIAGLVGA